MIAARLQGIVVLLLSAACGGGGSDGGPIVISDEPSFLTALESSESGDVIELAAGARLTGSFTDPNLATFAPNSVVPGVGLIGESGLFGKSARIGPSGLQADGG